MLSNDALNFPCPEPEAGSSKLPRGGTVIELDVAWGDMDLNGHVNNAVYFRYFENARIAYLKEVGWLSLADHDQVGFVLKSVNAVFRAPLRYPDRITVTAEVGKMEEDRVTLNHRVTSLSQGVVVAEGQGVVVAFDFSRMKKMKLPPELAARMLRDEGGGAC